MGVITRIGTEEWDEIDCGSNSGSNAGSGSRRSNSCPPTYVAPENATQPKTDEPQEEANETEDRPKDRPRANDIPEEPVSRVSKAAADRMRLLTQLWRQTATKWVRVVHSGYGNQAWKHDLKNSSHTFVAACSHPEGSYVHIPDGTTVDQIVDDLMEMNLAVRKKTQFRDMKRANKSRLQFKALITVPSADGKATNEDGSTTASDSRKDSSIDAPGEYLEQLAVGARRAHVWDRRAADISPSQPEWQQARARPQVAPLEYQDPQHYAQVHQPQPVYYPQQPLAAPAPHYGEAYGYQQQGYAPYAAYGQDPRGRGHTPAGYESRSYARTPSPQPYRSPTQAYSEPQSQPASPGFLQPGSPSYQQAQPFSQMAPQGYMMQPQSPKGYAHAMAPMAPQAAPQSPQGYHMQPASPQGYVPNMMPMAAQMSPQMPPQMGQQVTPPQDDSTEMRPVYMCVGMVPWSQQQQQHGVVA